MHLGLWKGLRFYFRVRVGTVRRWSRLSGDVRRTAGHEALWSAFGVAFVGLGGFLRFGTKGSGVHLAGDILLALSAWIGLAFFTPAWLPRVRDAELIKERRAQDKAQQDLVVAVLKQEISKIRSGSPIDFQEVVDVLRDDHTP
jgi:hypothetical protein